MKENVPKSSFSPSAQQPLLRPPTDARFLRSPWLPIAAIALSSRSAPRQHRVDSKAAPPPGSVGRAGAATPTSDDGQQPMVGASSSRLMRSCAECLRLLLGELQLPQGCERLSFLDAYSGYNQIRLKEEDEVKTAFITPYGVFCYRTMPFGLKNAGATYQRMMQKCLATQIGKNVQVYIDDVVITTKKGSTLIEDLKETFDNLDKFCLKLNPTKCSFGVPAGELLGFLVSARGIEANPEKIQAILTMRKPTK
ncbi:hypothetical protein QYE76_065975 [Lolium multiflorum]|uniref:Reverse transcriptase domain-containing protein n=1 Tax=Lolium multiflorum TaxID=4521 RepID=A0AAD8WAE9_LOLMU|nr:hypothetical protein QYE76_065975 [Lolium multiflorum]